MGKRSSSSFTSEISFVVVLYHSNKQRVCTMHGKTPRIQNKPVVYSEQKFILKNLNPLCKLCFYPVNGLKNISFELSWLAILKVTFTNRPFTLHCNFLFYVSLFIVPSLTLISQFNLKNPTNLDVW